VLETIFFGALSTILIRSVGFLLYSRFTTALFPLYSHFIPTFTFFFLYVCLVSYRRVLAVNVVFVFVEVVVVACEDVVEVSFLVV
jgi:hypothetical protein